jgi:putative transposase
MRESGAEPPHSTSCSLFRLANGRSTRPNLFSDWPHSPLHRLAEGGTYIVTAATHGQEPLFRTRLRLSSLCQALQTLSQEYEWNLQAWAVFPNHYHFVGISASGATLLSLIRHLHSVTARDLNHEDARPGRKVWFQYWETRVTNQRSYFARLRYVHENAVRHGLVHRASNYPWCSAGWFERTATPAFRKTVLGFPCDRITVPDEFNVKSEDLGDA